MTSQLIEFGFASTRAAFMSQLESVETVLGRYVATQTRHSIDPAWTATGTTRFVSAYPPWWTELPSSIRSAAEVANSVVVSAMRKASAEAYDGQGASVTTGSQSARSTGATTPRSTPTNDEPPKTESSGPQAPTVSASGTPTTTAPLEASTTGAASSLKKKGMGAGVVAGAIAGLAML